jgi:hypothetical protein
MTVIHIRIMLVYLTSVSCTIVHLAHVIFCYELRLHFACNASLHRQLKLMCFFPVTASVVSVEDYKHRGAGFDSRALLRIFLWELGLERGPLSFVIG